VNDTRRWRVVRERDGRFDGRFVYAVRSTGIYCRPSCPSRKPARPRVAFFDLPEAAEAKGFRACRRCRPRDAAPVDRRLAVVRDLCRRLETGDGQPASLADLGRAAGLSPHHLQRTFKRIIGVSPRQYADAVRLKRLKARLRKGGNVTDALYEAGYGSSSRLYEKAPARLGMTPATYQAGGKGTEIAWTIVPCRLGRLLLAATSRGLCAVSLGASDGPLEAFLRDEYPAADLRRDDAALAPLVAPVLGCLDGLDPGVRLPIDVRATAFQWRVYEALRAIPSGATRSYGAIARSLGMLKGARAVARACATNRVAVVVPCHRVVREDGGLGGYRWGIDRKQAILDAERRAAGQRGRGVGAGATRGAGPPRGAATAASSAATFAKIASRSAGVAGPRARASR
jgi:AraC family transcriptional regulator, regulatory protein of adaptative response / methylated-DNA-[protein]-cysteine methyltransferase